MSARSEASEAGPGGDVSAEASARPADSEAPREHVGPEGSAYEAQRPERRRRSLRRRIRGWFSRLLVGSVAWAFPYLYYAYCWFVWKTSRVEDGLTGPLLDAADRHDRFVALLWHQEVFTVAFAYRHLRGHTLASTGNFGRIITRMLELCNFVVFRGGSSRGRARRRQVLRDMIQHMKETPRVLYGITVDGSHGPAFQMKPGGVLIAKPCRSPLFVVRTWYSRCWQANTWDRTAFPLPFGRIKMWAVGPYWIDPQAKGEEMQRVLAHLNDELLDLAEHSFRAFESRPRQRPREGFPAGWQPRWTSGQLGIPFGPHDLRPDDPPPWANRPRP